MKDIEIVDIDYSAKKTEYRKEDKIKVSDMSGVFIIPEEGPFFGDSLRVIKGGLPLTPEKDYVPCTQDTELTLLTGKAVYLHIEVKDHIVSTGGELSVVYQRVVKPVISVKQLLKLLEDMILNGGTIDWNSQIEGIPKTFYPAQHSHDIQNSKELVGFGGMIELFQQLTHNQINNGGEVIALLKNLEKDLFDKLNYQQKLLWGAIMKHIRDYTNPHDLKPGDVDAGLIKNYPTAKPQEDFEGIRWDLYSTPAGLKRVIEDSEPETDDFIIQNELPFSYYGSGMYLPPPIAGSFEGLGGDVEDSAFCLEGNGWTVGLIRGFDTRVKNLYYIYSPDMQERVSNWMHTYVQYRHPTIDAANAKANYVVSGSDSEVLMICDSDKHLAWICASNSTFDPSAHDMKAIDLNVIRQTSPSPAPPTYEAPIMDYYGRMNIARVGAWVYMFYSSNDNPDAVMIDPNNVNFTTYIWRFPYAKLTDKNVTSIAWERCTMSFDTLARERITGKQYFQMARQVPSADGKIKQHYCKFAPYNATVSQSHRKRAFIIRSHPNGENKARIKIMFVIYAGYQERIEEPLRTFWGNCVADYEFDADTNTMTLDPTWVMGTMDFNKGDMVYPNEKIEKRQRLWWAGAHIFSFENICSSWIPGYGFLSLATAQVGNPPYSTVGTQMNQWNDPRRDYEAIWQDINLPSVTGFEKNTWQFTFKMASPFGYAGYPRYHSDIYRDGTTQLASPIEIFRAEADNGYTKMFYRVTDPTGLDMVERDSFKSDYIRIPILGRKTTANYGEVIGHGRNMGQCNFPHAPNKAHTRQIGLFTRSVILPNGTVTSDKFTETVDFEGKVAPIKTDANGGILLPLIPEYKVDGINKTLKQTASKTSMVYMPEAVHHKFIQQILGDHMNDIIEYHYSWYIASQPGRDNVPRSMFNVVYHRRSEPAVSRMVAGVFNWSENGKTSEGYPIMKMDNIEYPFRGRGEWWGGTGDPSTTEWDALFAPPPADNRWSVARSALQPDNTWKVMYPVDNEPTVQDSRMEILQHFSEGPLNLTQIWIPPYRIEHPGNADTLRLWYDVRAGKAVEGIMTYRAGQAFRESDWQIWVAPDRNIGITKGVLSDRSGGAMGLWERWSNFQKNGGRLVNGQPNPPETPENLAKWYVASGATFTEGNWTIFVNSDVTVTFNGYSMTAMKTIFDLEQLGVPYKDTTFYIYCMAQGSTARYEITKTLQMHNPYAILVATIKTTDLGIDTIEREQNFNISGFGLTRDRDAGIPVSSGSILEQGTYRFLRRDELYKD